MNKALKYDAPFGHICKLNPTQVHEFYMESSQTEEAHFRAKVHIEKTILIHSDDNTNNNTEDQSKHLFVIDIDDLTLEQVYVNKFSFVYFAICDEFEPQLV